MGSAGEDFLRSVLGSDYGSNSGDDVGEPPAAPAPSGSEGSADQAAAEEVDSGDSDYLETLHQKIEDVQETQNSWFGDAFDGFFNDMHLFDEQTKQPAGDTGGGAGGYTFDPDTMAYLINEFEGLSEEVRDNSMRMNILGQWMWPPTGDDAAAKQVRSTIDSLTAAAEHSAKLSGYSQKFRDSLHKANGTYVDQDGSVSDLFKGSDGEGGSGALFA